MTDTSAISALAQAAIEADLVTRLTDYSNDPYFHMTPGVKEWLQNNDVLRQKAATEITRLHTELAEARGALEECAKLCDESAVEAERLRGLVSPGDIITKISRTTWLNTARQLGLEIRALKSNPPAEKET